MMTRNECARWLESRDRYCILTHRRPDGDTVGSAAVLCRGLRAMGKTAFVAENEEITGKYRPLLSGLTKPEPEAEDTLICVDVASEGMLPRAFQKYLGRIALRIDHHDGAESFTDQALVDPAAGACGEIIYDILTQTGVTPDKKMAEALYTAVSTDTGCFRYANTTAHSFTVAAACSDTGADLYAINQALFETNTFARLKMQSWIVENIRFSAGGALAVIAIPREVEQAIGVTEDDMENISGFPRSIAGVCMAATLRQTEDGLVKLSLRAVPGYDASKVCARFGGGGHKGAAGASMKMTLEEAARTVETVMQEQYQ